VGGDCARRVLAVACSQSATGKSDQAASVLKVKIGQSLIPPTDIKAEPTSVKVVSRAPPHMQEVDAVATQGKALLDVVVVPWPDTQ
jgi:hypothetical protein